METPMAPSNTVLNRGSSIHGKGRLKGVEGRVKNCRPTAIAAKPMLSHTTAKRQSPIIALLFGCCHCRRVTVADGIVRWFRAILRPVNVNFQFVVDGTRTDDVIIDHDHVLLRVTSR